MSLRKVLRTYLPAPVVKIYDAIYAVKIRCCMRQAFKRKMLVREQKKIIYALTPPPQLRNIGDQAQTIAIHRWLQKHYPSLPIVEVTKSEVLSCQDYLKKMVGQKDLIFLHSGGNLGDRGMWSESGRRFMIQNFHDNRIISLPQTIYFSDTPNGREQQDISRRIYGEHNKLTIIGRDKVSGELASQLFPNAQVMTMPDFVLSIQINEFSKNLANKPSKHILACLRLDDESAFSILDRDRLLAFISRPVTVYDTTIQEDIPPEKRDDYLRDTLELFAQHEAVITDRYHGVIFSLLCQKPTVVLRTVDHKLTSALDWFQEVPNLKFAEKLDDVPEMLEAALAIKEHFLPDFNKLYFDKLPQAISDWSGNNS